LVARESILGGGIPAVWARGTPVVEVREGAKRPRMRIISDSPCVACGSREESCCRTRRRLRTKYRRRHTDTFTYPTTFDIGRPASDPGAAARAEAEPTGRLAAPQPAIATRRSPPPPQRPSSERHRAGRDLPMKGPPLIGNHTITAATRIRQLASRPPPVRRRARCPADVMPCAQSSTRPRRESHGATRDP